MKEAPNLSMYRIIALPIQVGMTIVATPKWHAMLPTR